MTSNEFLYDILIFPLSENPIQKNLITTLDKVDGVIELERSDRCVIIVNTVKYSVDLSARRVCEMIYGRANNEDNT